jgi:hypothetical protein
MVVMEEMARMVEVDQMVVTDLVEIVAMMHSPSH